MSHLKLVHDSSRRKDLAAARDQLPTLAWGAVMITATACGLGYMGVTAYGLVQLLRQPWTAANVITLGLNIAFWVGLSVWIARLFGPNPFVPRAPASSDDSSEAPAPAPGAEPGFYSRLAWMTAALALPLPTLALLCIRNASRGKRILAAMALFTLAVLMLSVFLRG